MGIKDILGNKGVQGATFVPAIDALNTIGGNLTGLNSGAEFGNVVGNIKATVDSIIGNEAYNSFVNGSELTSGIITGAGVLGAGLLSNKVLKDLGLVGDKTLGVKNITRYALNGAAMLGAYSAGTVAAPYLAVGAGAYFIGKHGWKFSKELTKRSAGTAWGLTGGLVKGAAKGLWNSTKAGIKGEQKVNPVI